MKTLSQYIAPAYLKMGFLVVLGAALSLSSSNTALAQTAPPCKWTGIEQVSDFSYRVWACNPGAQRGSIKISDASGKVLHQEYSSAISFGNQFNVAELPDGEYQVRVQMGPKAYRYSINLQSSSKRWAQVKEQTPPAERRMVSAKVQPTIAAVD